MKKNNVTIYSTPTCHYCFKAKDYLKENGIEFKEIDVSVDQRAAQEMILKSGQMGVPVIEINSNIIVGFQPELISSLLTK